MRTALSLEKSLGARDARESRRSAPATTQRAFPSRVGMNWKV
nr:MAG TPA: hypothetical protein [Caudoviricetes sp.]